MGAAPENVGGLAGKAIRFAGVADTYDPDQITSNIQDALDQVTSFLEEPGTDAPAPISSEPFPSYRSVKRLALSVVAGTYGGVNDPRVAQVVEQSGSGLSADGRCQRFRFETGAALFAFARFPVKANGWAIFNVPPLVMGHGPAPSRVAFAALVPKIPHGLGRIPERVSLRTSAGDEGPTGQLVKSAGTGLYIPQGKDIRCDFDFIPVFGISADDIEWNLKHFCSFTNGLFGSDDLGGTTVDTSTYENPVLRRQVAIDMVTTTQHFGGILLATGWGWGTSAGGTDVAEPPSQVGREMGIVGLRNSVSDVDDGMITAVLPEIGKSIFALPLQAANLASYTGVNLRLILNRGTVDFLLE